MINKYRRTVNKDFEQSTFWPTFTDLISSVLIVVILILFSSESISGSIEQDLATNVNNSVEKTLKGAGIPVIVDEINGSITFGDSTLFDIDSDELKPEAKEMLKLFIPKYIQSIYSDYSEYISKIIIEGHTDDVGSYIYNLDLSQRRAYSVVEYIIGSEIGDYKYKEELTQDIVAIGRSNSELVISSDGSVDRDSSRRVEIKYEIKINE